MATYINGVDQSQAVAKGSVSVTNTLNSAIDTMQLEINPNSIVVQGGEEIIMTDEATRLPAPSIRNDTGQVTIQAANKPKTVFQTLEFWAIPANVGTRVNPLQLGSYWTEGTLTLETNGSVNFYHGANAGSSFYFGTLVCPAGTFVNGMPVHIAITRDLVNRRIKSYVNGVLWQNVVWPSYNDPVINDTYTWIFGNGYAGRYLGELLEVRVWEQVRTEEEIKRDMYKMTSGLETGLLAAWDFRDGQVADKTGNGSNGTASGTTFIQESSLSLAGHRVFAGHLANPEETGEKTTIGYAVQCQDYTPQLNHMLVNANFVSVKNAVGSYDDPATSSNVWTLGKIVRKLMTDFGPSGFTTIYCPADGDANTIIDSAQFSYVYLTDAFDELKKMTGYDWYVDYYKNLHFFKAETNGAPEALTDTSYNFKNLRVSIDRSQLRNRVYVKGGTQLTGPDPVSPTPTQILMGQATTSGNTNQAQAVFSLAHEPYELADPASFTVVRNSTNYKVANNSQFKIIVLRVKHTGGADDGQVLENMVVGVNNVHSFYDVNNVRTPYTALVQVDRIPWVKTFDPLPSNQRLEVYYQYKVPILVSADDQVSINAVKAVEGGSGIYEYIVDEPDIVTFDQARERARAELKRYANPIVSGRFETHRPGFVAGQTLSIDVTRPNGSRIQGQYVINEVVRTSDGVGWNYEVTFSMMLYDMEEFFRMLIKKVNRAEVAKNEILDVLYSMPEVLRFYENLDIGMEVPQLAKWSSDGALTSFTKAADATEDAFYTETSDADFNTGNLDRLRGEGGALVHVGATAPTFTRASVARRWDTGAEVAADVPRYDTGKYAGGQALLWEEATNNLVPNTNGRPNTLTAGGTTPPTVSLVTDQANPFGSQAWKIVFPATVTAGYEGCRAISDVYAFTAGKIYSYTLWVKGMPASNSGITFYHTGSSGTAPLVKTGRVIGSWEEYALQNATAGSPSGNDYLTIYASSTAAANRTIYIAASQVEQKKFRTSPVLAATAPVARAAESLTYPSDAMNKSVGSIEFWFKGMGGGRPGRGRLWGTGPDSSTNCFDLIFGGGDGLLYYRLTTGGNQGTATIADTFWDGTWRYIVCTWNASTGQKKLYVDGALVSTSTYSGNYVLQSPLGIGGMSGLYDNFRILNKELSAAEVSSRFSAGSSMPFGNDDSAFLPFNNDLKVRAYGQRTSNPISLTSLGKLNDSKITWTAASGSYVTVESSIDNGQTWQTCTSGQAIPGLTAGFDCAGKNLLIRETINSQDAVATNISEVNVFLFGTTSQLLRAQFDMAPVKSNLTVDVSTGGIKLASGQTQGELQTIWFDKGANARTFVDFITTATLPEGSNLRYYFRTSTSADGSNPSRWKTFEEVMTSLDRYWQMKVVFQSGSGTITPVLLDFTLKYMVLANPYAQYGHARWKP